MDDGYSGTNFNRPSWSELLERIENGEVSTLIVKDMSRLGRDYLKVGFYTEVLFEMCIRDSYVCFLWNFSYYAFFRRFMRAQEQSVVL